MHVPDKETYETEGEYSDDYEDSNYYDYNYYDSNAHDMDPSQDGSCIAQNDYEDYEVEHETHQMVAFFCEFQNYSAHRLSEETITLQTNATRHNFELSETNEVKVYNRSIPLKSRNFILIIFLVIPLYLA